MGFKEFFSGGGQDNDSRRSGARKPSDQTGGLNLLPGEYVLRFPRCHVPVLMGALAMVSEDAPGENTPDLLELRNRLVNDPRQDRPEDVLRVPVTGLRVPRAIVGLLQIFRAAQLSLIDNVLDGRHENPDSITRFHELASDASVASGMIEQINQVIERAHS